MNAEADKKERERMDKINQADSMIFQTEKQLSEFGDKLPTEKKTAIETALNGLKEAHKSQDLGEMDRQTELLNQAWQVASQDMYQAQANQSGQGTPNQNGNDEKVTDVEFEEVNKS
jgi:molecular chaperone DnaK